MGTEGVFVSPPWFPTALRAGPHPQPIPHAISQPPEFQHGPEVESWPGSEFHKGVALTGTFQGLLSSPNPNLCFGPGPAEAKCPTSDNQPSPPGTSRTPYPLPATQEPPSARLTISLWAIRIQ
uniref:Uncharacterized protein n=1 Tax=Pipistrellus kuhlii TaxID=59472 RepID=A0A7J7U9W5_PIPKU|nr:hypothetical protein mPipKuh1_009129 [Pipistrellus kuhlii]